MFSPVPRSLPKNVITTKRMPAWVVLSSHAKMDVFTVDSFSHSPFTGNPAGVCVLEAGREPLSDNLMQKISAEMNLSETAFVQP